MSFVSADFIGHTNPIAAACERRHDARHDVARTSPAASVRDHRGAKRSAPRPAPGIPMNDETAVNPIRTAGYAFIALVLMAGALHATEKSGSSARASCGKAADATPATRALKPRLLKLRVIESPVAYKTG